MTDGCTECGCDAETTLPYCNECAKDQGRRARTRTVVVSDVEKARERLTEHVRNRAP